MITTIPLFWSILAMFVLGLSVFVVMDKRRDRFIWSVILSSVLVPVSFLFLSYPRPTNRPFVFFTNVECRVMGKVCEKQEVAWADFKPREYIFIIVKSKGSFVIPRYYVMEWDDKKAAELSKAMERASREGGKVVVTWGSVTKMMNGKDSPRFDYELKIQPSMPKEGIDPGYDQDTPF